MGWALVCVTAAAQSTNSPGGGNSPGDQAKQRSQDRMQTSSPKLEQKRTRLSQSLPGSVQQAVQDMKQARERYQQQLQDKKKELTASTMEERERLREQLRERLQTLRESLPSHTQLLEQAREQVQQRERRGD